MSDDASERSPHPEPGQLAQLGAQLRAAGLTARALAAWTGAPWLAAVPARLATVRAPTPAGAILALLVAGAEVARAELRISAAVLDELVAHQLVERVGDRLRARVAIAPLGSALVVCDRIDAAADRDRVCWPDDSSHHLASAIPPGRRADWLDLGCGSAAAALARPELAARIAGVDINPRAIRHARLGAALSAISHVALSQGDLGADHEPAALVTCNAPIPQVADVDVWHRAEPGLFDRLWPALARSVRRGGMIVVHAACDALIPGLTSARGERVIAAYTPSAVRGFAVAWWRPDAPDRLVAGRRVLTPDRPHVDPRDRDDLLAL